MEPEPESQVFLVNASSQQSGKDGAPAEKGAPPDREALDDWSSPLIRPSDYFPGYALGGHKIMVVSPSRRSRESAVGCFRTRPNTRCSIPLWTARYYLQLTLCNKTRHAGRTLHMRFWRGGV